MQFGDYVHITAPPVCWDVYSLCLWGTSIRHPSCVRHPFCTHGQCVNDWATSAPTVLSVPL